MASDGVALVGPVHRQGDDTALLLDANEFAHDLTVSVILRHRG
jgi:hypothetical protein